MSTFGSLSIYSYSRLSAAGLKCGFSADEVLVKAGIEFDMQRKVGYDLTLSNILDLYTAALAASRRNYFPLAMAEHFSFDFLPEVEAFLSTSPTLDSAAKIIDWLPALLVPEFQFAVVPKGNAVAFQVDIEGADTTKPACQGIVETVVACAVLFLRKLLSADARYQVCLKHGAVVADKLYETTLGHAPTFGAAFNGLLIPMEELSRPIAKGAGRVNALTALAIETTIKAMDSNKSVSGLVLKRLNRTPNASADEVATQLGLPVRTLQRRLQEENTSFQVLQNQALCTLAKNYLANQDLDVEAIALKLGFSDRHSFTRAFKRWTGSTPSGWRQTSALAGRT